MRASPVAAGERASRQQAGIPGSESDIDSVADGDFWLCGTAIPRSYGICEHVLVSSKTGRGSSNATDTLTSATGIPSVPVAAEDDLPVSVVPDLATDPRFCDRPYIHNQPFQRFYAGVPIRTPGPDGVNIGVYCIFDTQPRPQGLTADELKFMRDMSRTSMGYLECRAASARYRASERMVKGMGNFVEGLDALAPVGGRAMGRMGLGLAVHRSKSKLADVAETAPGDDGDVRKSDPVPVPVRRKQPEPPLKSIGSGARIRDDFVLSPLSPSTPALTTESPDGSKSGDLLGPAAAAASVASFRPPLSFLPPDDSSRSSTPRNDSQQQYGDASPRPSLAQVSTADLQRVESARVFSKAANIIRQSLDVDGVLYLDATVRSFGGLVGQSERKASFVGLENLNYMSNDEDAMSQHQGQSAANSEDHCNVLGYAMLDGSSIQGDLPPWQFQDMRDRTLQRLLRRYPNGKIFNFDADGELLQSPIADDRDPPTPGLTPGLPPKRPASVSRQWSTEGQEHEEPLTEAAPGQVATPTISRTSKRGSAADSIIQLFPGARSVVLIPLWDAQKKRWVAGGFLWTNSPTRTFTTDGTLSFLRVFGLVVMADIYKISLKAEETMKSNILGSISHELRSPLHGLVGAVELLHDSKLDAVQHNVLNIIETSGKTLVDTINHLLDYSKINSFIENDKKDTILGKVGAEEKDRRFEKQHSTATAELDCLVEEVVESVLAGFSHERLSGTRATRDVMEYRKHSDALGNLPTTPMSAQGDRVQIYLDIEPGKSWGFHTHPGAFRRIVMNLFGNSLKFTKSGFIKISLTQEPAKPYQQNSRASVLLTVSDSGKGISEDYLHNSLFTPFCQEDQFAPGTGLGLSLVRQIAVNIGGEVKVVSQVGRGTTITVSLPLTCAKEAPEGQDLTGSMKDIVMLKGKKVLLRGFDGGDEQLANDRWSTQDISEGIGKLVESQAYFLENTCRNWLQMHVLDEAEASVEAPDFIIHHDSTLSFAKAEDIAVKAPCPVLFVCEATVAVRNFSWNLPNAESRIRTFEFFSTPLGPRKLAKGLVHLINMWKVRQDRSEPFFPITIASAEATPKSKEDKTLSLDAKAAFLSAREADAAHGVITLVQSPGTSLVSKPKADVKPSPLPTPPEDQAERVPQVVVASPTTNEGPFVLIVDDNAINLKVSSPLMNQPPRSSYLK